MSGMASPDGGGGPVHDTLVTNCVCPSRTVAFTTSSAGRMSTSKLSRNGNVAAAPSSTRAQRAMVPALGPWLTMRYQTTSPAGAEGCACTASDK